MREERGSGVRRPRAWKPGLLLIVLVTWGASPLAANPWQGFTALVLSADGRWFATGGREGEVLWWEASTGELRSRWVLSGGVPVVALAFQPGATRLAAETLDGRRALLTPGEGRASSVAGEGESVDSRADPLGGAVDRWVAAPPPAVGLRTSSGDLWAVGTADGRISVGSVAQGKTLASWQAHQAAVTGLAFSPDGSYLLSCSYDGTIGRWDPRTGSAEGGL